MGAPKALKASPVDSFTYQKGRLSQPVLNPQQFSSGAQFKQRKTIHVGGSTTIRYNLKGAFSIQTEAGGGHASTGQGGRSRLSRSTGGFYQRKVRTN